VKRVEAESILGLVGQYDATMLRDHWRRAAREHHPDHGGSNESMAKVNEAYATLSEIPGGTVAVSKVPEPNEPVIRSVDRPAFVIDALPVVAFETLIVAARVLGDVVDDDPPYVLECLIDHDGATSWCRLDLVPDAGSSTVSITSDGRVRAEDLCHLWVATVNELGVVQ